MIIAYDARPLQPATRHWGVGVVLDNLLPRLRHRFELAGISHRFPGAENEGITTWPRIPKMNNFAFEASVVFVKHFDVYWGTNDFIPALNSRPSLLTVYDLLLLRYPSDQPHTRFLAWRLASSIKRARKVVTISQATADDLLVAFPGIGKKLEVALLGFDSSLSEDHGICSSNLYSQQQPFALMLGAHRPRKNLALAVRAVAVARERGNKLNLVITGNIHQSFEPLIHEYRDFVIRTGVLPKPDLLNLLNNASALLFPSIYEGFGLPMLEAMAAGCPVLALDTPVNREVSRDAARLLPEDPQLWASELAEVLRIPAKAEEMRERGFANLRRFSWDNTAKSYVDLLHHLGTNGNN